MTSGEATTGARPAVLVAALVLTGLTMRTTVTSIGAVLDDLQHGLGMSGGVAGLVTTLPVLCFAGLGAVTPRLARALGEHRLLTLALVVAVLGTALRPVVGSAAPFVLLSVLALVGGAMSNVLLPSLVKRHFPDRIGTMTAVYTTALAVGATGAAGLTVPIGDLGDGWRLGLGSWAVLTALAVLPWLPTLAHDTRPHDLPGAGAVFRPSTLVRSRTAWALTLFFGSQSMQAYISFGWFARFFRDHGVGAGTAGLLLAFFSAVGIPISAVAPRVPQRRRRPVILALCACNLVAYLGLAVAPVGGSWVWMLLAGVGGGTFPMALTLIGLRARTVEATRALSAFVQAIGYVLAGSGPLLFGALFGATGSWALPLLVLFVATAVTIVTAFPITAERYVDDEVAVPVPVSPS